MKATLKNYRQSPRKVRLVADLVRGKLVNQSLDMLRFVDKKAAEVVTKVIKSALANAGFKAGDRNTLMVKNIVVDKAPTFRRVRFRARGSSARINKRNSHITVELG